MSAPNRLCTIDGVLVMKDGSSVQDYLRSVPHMGTNPDVVLISRDKLEALDADADAYRRLVTVESDERFALAGQHEKTPRPGPLGVLPGPPVV